MLLVASCWVPCNGLASHPGGSSNTPSHFILWTLWWTSYPSRESAGLPVACVQQYLCLTFCFIWYWISGGFYGAAASALKIPEPEPTPLILQSLIMMKNHSLLLGMYSLLLTSGVISQCWKWNEYVTYAVESQFKQLQRDPFEPVASVLEITVGHLTMSS